MSDAGDKLRKISGVARTAVLRGILKYSGGRVVGSGKKSGGRAAKTSVPAGSTILAGHFRQSNSKIYAPLSPKYAKAKDKKFGKKPILVATGKTKKSLLAKAKIMPKGNDVYKVTFPKRTFYSVFLVEQKDRHPTRPTKEDTKKIGDAVATALKQLLQGINKT